MRKSTSWYCWFAPSVALRHYHRIHLVALPFCLFFSHFVESFYYFTYVNIFATNKKKIVFFVCSSQVKHCFRFTLSFTVERLSTVLACGKRVMHTPFIAMTTSTFNVSTFPLNALVSFFFRVIIFLFNIIRLVWYFQNDKTSTRIQVWLSCCAVLFQCVRVPLSLFISACIHLLPTESLIPY